MQVTCFLTTQAFSLRAPGLQLAAPPVHRQPDPRTAWSKPKAKWSHLIFTGASDPDTVTWPKREQGALGGCGTRLWGVFTRRGLLW